MNRITLISTALFLLILSGCAQKHWKDPLEEKAATDLRKNILTYQEQQQKCPVFVNAEVTASWDSKLYDGGITGYLQLLFPASIKVVAINPLGQPIFAITTDGKGFQAINAVKGVFKHGRVARFAEHYDLPADIIGVNWAEWLSARSLFNDSQLKELRGDDTERGVWLVLEKTEGRKTREYLLYDTTQRKILERISINEKGSEIARIIYSKWTPDSRCPLPQSVEIHGSSVGGDIKIQLSEIITETVHDSTDFNLKLPPNYMRQYYP